MIVICPIAGVGTRLLPITNTKPKAMIKICGKTILDHLMEKISETFPKGTKIIFIVGYLKEILTSYIDEHYSEDFNIEYFEQKPLGFKNNKPYYSGLADAIGLAENMAKGEDIFIFLSDRLPMVDYSNMLSKIISDNLDGIINVRIVSDPQHYGVCVLNEKGLLEKIIEKPKEFISNVAVSGAYLFNKKFSPVMFELIGEQSKQPLELGKEHQFTNIIQGLIEKGAKIGVNIVQDQIIDFGRIKRLLIGNELLIEKYAKSIDKKDIIKNKNVKNSVIIPPVYIGENCSISKSTIGPHVSIGDNVKIEKSIVSNSVIEDNCNLISFSTKNSIISDGVTIKRIGINRLCVSEGADIEMRKDASNFIYTDN